MWDIGEKKIMLHSTFTADWWEASWPFSDSICCSETLESSGFSSHHTPFLAYDSLNLFYLWAGSGGDLSYLPLSTWTKHPGEQNRAAAPADRSCFALFSHLSWSLKRDQAPATIRARSWESSSRSCWPHWSLTSFTQADMSLNLDVFTSFKYLASDPKSPCMKDWLWFW